MSPRGCTVRTSCHRWVEVSRAAGGGQLQRPICLAGTNSVRQRVTGASLPEKPGGLIIKANAPTPAITLSQFRF